MVAWLALIGGVMSGIIVAINTRLWWAAFAGIGSSLVTFLLFGTLGYIAENITKQNDAAVASEVSANRAVFNPVDIYVTTKNLSDPYVLKFYVDDKLLGPILSGTSSCYPQVDLPIGKHTLKIEKDDAESFRNELIFEINQATEIQVYCVAKKDSIEIDPLTIS